MFKPKKKTQVYCETCCSMRSFHVIPTRDTYTYKGQVVLFPTEKALCDMCGNGVFVSSIRDKNLSSLEYTMASLGLNTKVF